MAAPCIPVWLLQKFKDILRTMDWIENDLRKPTTHTVEECPPDVRQKLQRMAQEQKRQRKERQEEHTLVFSNPEEVLHWYTSKRKNRKPDKFLEEKIREYYTGIADQEELEEALGWLTEHLFDDYKVTLKYALPSGQLLTARNYDFKEKR